jgi:hypothetical protein
VTGTGVRNRRRAASAMRSVTTSVTASATANVRVSAKGRATTGATGRVNDVPTVSSLGPLSSRRRQRRIRSDRIRHHGQSSRRDRKRCNRSTR